ncbi:YrdC domain-containing protein [Blattella germanica]|nr:YrdC domain-containing protein [Blattella germanica]
MSKVFEIHAFRYCEIIEQAACHIQAGGIIAVPTDTVYGLATAAQNQDAVNRLYNIKGRDPNKPIAICLDAVDSIPLWGDINSIPLALLNKLLPGPVTVVLKRLPLLNSLLNPSIPNVGIRIPKCTFMNSLCKMIGMPLALTSANFSNEQSALSPEEFKHLWPQLSAVFHKGELGNIPELRTGSTIVDLTKPDRYCILRSGSALGVTQSVLKEFGLVEDVTNGVI